jgi:predicted NBD/HSP70 family sugar kinase
MPPNPATLAPVRRQDIRRTADYRRTTSAAAVLHAALDHGPVARSTVARLAGLSPAAVSRLCADLNRAGLLRDAPGAGPNNGAGRPHVPVDIDTGRQVACGLHLAVRDATLALLDLRGRVIARERVPHAGAGPGPVLRRLAQRIPAFAGEHAGGRALLGLGVATGGWVDPGDGVIVEHPLLGWRDVPAREIMAAATGLDVRVDNHSRALARAERMFGDPRARASIVHLFVGNVVDAAFATGGTVHHGPQSAAGAVAHLPLDARTEPCHCGRRGCFQAAVSSRALARRAARAGIIAGPSFPALLAAARAGNQRAVEVFRDRARLVGAAAALLLDVLNPEVLVVTEAGTAHLPECLELLRDEVRSRSAGAGAGAGARAGAGAGDPGGSVAATSFGTDALPVAGGAVILDAVYTAPLRLRAAVSCAS